MRFAENREIFNAAAGSGDRVGDDAWPPRGADLDRWGEEGDWTDDPIPFALVPDVPETPPGPTRRGFLGMLGVAAAGAALPPAVAATAAGAADGPLMAQYRRWVAEIERGLAIEAEGPALRGLPFGHPAIEDQEDRLDESVRRDGVLYRDLLAMVAAAAGHAMGDASRIDHDTEATVAAVREGDRLFLLLVDDYNGDPDVYRVQMVDLAALGVAR